MSKVIAIFWKALDSSINLMLIIVIVLTQRPLGRLIERFDNLSRPFVCLLSALVTPRFDFGFHMVIFGLSLGILGVALGCLVACSVIL